MAAVFDLDDRRSASARADGAIREAFEMIAEHLLELPARAAMRELEGGRGVLDATEARILAGYVKADGDTRRAEKVAGSTGRSSKRASKRKARRAKAVKANGRLAEKVAAGEMTDEHLDVIADTADKTRGAAALDDEFIDTIAGTDDPDQAGRAGREYVATHATAAGTQSRHLRQRARRTASRFTTKDDLDAVIMLGDTETIDAIWKAATSTAATMYRADGGRDVPLCKHPRTRDQRTFDALAAHILRTETVQSDARSDEATTGASPGANHGAASKRYTPRQNRPLVVVGVTLDKFLGIDPDQAAELIGVGPIADSVLAEYIAHGDIVAALYGQAGQPLWLSRSNRYGTLAQRQALIIRDKGCVRCGAPHSDCDVHHLTPWNAPACGQTDITKLALLCPSCHHDLHTRNQTLYRDRDTGQWKRRPATPAETPPSHTQTRPPPRE